MGWVCRPLRGLCRECGPLFPRLRFACRGLQPAALRAEESERNNPVTLPPRCFEVSEKGTGGLLHASFRRYRWVLLVFPNEFWSAAKGSQMATQSGDGAGCKAASCPGCSEGPWIGPLLLLRCRSEFVGYYPVWPNSVCFIDTTGRAKWSWDGLSYSAGAASRAWGKEGDLQLRSRSGSGEPIPRESACN